MSANRVHTQGRLDYQRRGEKAHARVQNDRGVEEWTPAKQDRIDELERAWRDFIAAVPRARG